MFRILLLAWRYICFHKLKTSILVVSITLTLALPLAVHTVMDHYQARLMARALDGLPIEAIPALTAKIEEGYDLVEVAPNANPPVCRIMDYGKYKYEQKKKAAARAVHCNRARRYYEDIGRAVFVMERLCHLVFDGSQALDIDAELESMARHRPGRGGRT